MTTRVSDYFCGIVRKAKDFFQIERYLGSMNNLSPLGKDTSIWMDTAPSTNYPSLSKNIETDVAVVGGGIAGLLTAYFLKQAGFKVAVIEEYKIATGTTGYTTAKITSAHGLIYKYLIDKFGQEKAQIYADANQNAIEKIADLVEKLKIDCDFVRLPAFTYVLTNDQDKEVEEEVEAAKSLGLPVSFACKTPLPYPISSTIQYANQAKFHPRKFLLKIAEEIDGDGSYIFEETRFLALKENDRVEIETDKGKIIAQKVVIATNYPVYDPAGFFARLTSRQSHTIGAEVQGPLPYGVFYGIEKNNFHSLRTQPLAGNKEILIIGGGLHRTGQNIDPKDQYFKLVQWAKENFSLKSVKYHWTTSDSESYDKVPMIGHLTPHSKNLYIAAGFSGWGMTHGMIAATILTDEIQGKEHPWSKLYSPDRFSSFFTWRGLGQNIKNVETLIGSRMKKYDNELLNIAKGEGAVREIGGEKLAVYRDDQGKIHAISAVCTHMGCIIGWNNTDKTWDCPCHGSRFSTEGNVIHGPAIKNLKQIDATATR